MSEELTETTSKPSRTGPVGPDPIAWNTRRHKGTLIGLVIAGSAFTVMAFEFLQGSLGPVPAGGAIIVVGLVLAALFQMTTKGSPPTAGTWENSASRPEQPLARYCAHCAAPNAIGSSYCSNCGDRL
jgi:hypothetical protein